MEPTTLNAILFPFLIHFCILGLQGMSSMATWYAVLMHPFLVIHVRNCGVSIVFFSLSMKSLSAVK